MIRMYDWQPQAVTNASPLTMCRGNLHLQANHAAAGVEKGLKSSNHMPIEVMGLMQGHIDTETPGCLIVTDVFPLPVEGTETTVMSDNQEVMNYMIRLGGGSPVTELAFQRLVSPRT